MKLEEEAVPRQERERRYIAEYMLETFPGGNYQLNVELGPIPEELTARYGLRRAAALFRPTRLRVDAVHWSPERYLLVEAKLRAIKNGIGDLLIYQRVAPKTPDLPFYDGQPIVLRLVIPYMVDWVKDITDAHDIEYATFDQPWIRDYAIERQEYFTAPYREKRAERQKLIDLLIPEE